MTRPYRKLGDDAGDLFPGEDRSEEIRAIADWRVEHIRRALEEAKSQSPTEHELRALHRFITQGLRLQYAQRHFQSLVEESEEEYESVCLIHSELLNRLGLFEATVNMPPLRFHQRHQYGRTFGRIGGGPWEFVFPQEPFNDEFTEEFDRAN